MTYFMLYILAIIDYINITFGIAAGIVVCMWVVGFIVWCCTTESYSESDQKINSYLQKIVSKAAWITGVIVLLNILIPSQKSVVMILAGGTTFDVITSPQAKEVGGKSLDLLNKFLDEQLQEKTKKDKKDE